MGLSVIEIQRLLRIKDDQIANLTLEIRNLKEELERSTIEHQSAIQSLQEKTNKEIEKLRQSTKQTLEEKELELQNVQKDARKLAEQVSKLQTKNRELEKQKLQNVNVIASEEATKQLDSLRSEKDKEIMDLQTQLTVLQTELEYIRSTTPQSTELLEKTGEVKILRDKMESMKGEMLKLRQQLVAKEHHQDHRHQDLLKEIEKLKTQLRFKDEDLRCLQEELSFQSSSPSPSSNRSISTPPSSANNDEINEKKRRASSPSLSGVAQPVHKKPKSPQRDDSVSNSRIPFQPTSPNRNPLELQVQANSDQTHTITSSSGVRIVIEPNHRT